MACRTIDGSGLGKRDLADVADRSWAEVSFELQVYFFAVRANSDTKSLVISKAPFGPLRWYVGIDDGFQRDRVGHQ
jgi:hypothetical protein